MLGLWKRVRVCQRWSPGAAGGQGATPRPDSVYGECTLSQSSRRRHFAAGCARMYNIHVRADVERMSSSLMHEDQHGVT